MDELDHIIELPENLPDPVCSVGLISFQSDADLLFPTFITRFDTDLAIKLVDKAERADLKVSPDRVDSSEISLAAHFHVQCKCIPVTTRFLHRTSPATIINFFGRLAATKCFIWLMSTPSFEIRLLVQTSDGTVVKRYERERVLH